MFVRISDDEVHAWQGCDLIGGSLGVTSGHYDSGVGILAANSADGGAGILVCARCYRARIQHYNRSLRGAGGASQALLFELAFESGAIGLRGATAKILYKKSGHNLW